MSTPRASSALIFLLAIQCVSAEPRRDGRMVTGCVDRAVSSAFCGWITRYQPAGTQVRVKSAKT